jgi:hypothetical protein
VARPADAGTSRARERPRPSAGGEDIEYVTANDEFFTVKRYPATALADDLAPGRHGLVAHPLRLSLADLKRLPVLPDSSALVRCYLVAIVPTILVTLPLRSVSQRSDPAEQPPSWRGPFRIRLAARRRIPSLPC